MITDFFQGYLELIKIEQVTEPQIWRFNGEDIVVCDKGLKWLSILPEKEYYCITAMLNEENEIIRIIGINKSHKRPGIRRNSC